MYDEYGNDKLFEILARVEGPQNTVDIVSQNVIHLYTPGALFEINLIDDEQITVLKGHSVKGLMTWSVLAAELTSVDELVKIIENNL